MNGNLVKNVLLMTQGIGAVFFFVFLASYAGALPSNRVLHAEPVFHIPISIFGAIFLALTIALLVAAFALKRKNS
jgi:hypothetical protein